MPNFGAGDVPALLRDLGVDVTLGATTVKGLVDRAGSRILEGDGTPAAMIGRDILVTMQQGSLPGLAVKSQLTVDGVSWVVSTILEIEDGELITLYLRKP
jgi:hypothetical protein